MHVSINYRDDDTYSICPLNAKSSVLSVILDYSQLTLFDSAL